MPLFNESKCMTPVSANRKLTPASKAVSTTPKSAPAKVISPSRGTPKQSSYESRYLKLDLDLQGLFDLINEELFNNRIKPATLRWSMKMTASAGVTSYYGKKEGVVIALSKPLLALRPRKDLLETLIHEMIHAFLFIRDGDRAEREEHGPNYMALQDDINKKTGFKITVKHDFEDEADFLKTPKGKTYMAELKDL